MRILILASEVMPLAKTGGLADVAGALPIALSRLGHDVAVSLPKYRTVTQKNAATELLANVSVLVGAEFIQGQIEKTTLSDTSVPVFLVAQDGYFDRENLYDYNGRGYRDNLARFSFFCRSILQWLERSDWVPDIIHCNDWQTALVPLLLKTEYANHPKLSKIKTLFSVHNLSYQGLFPAEQISVAGIGWEHFHIDGIEFWGQINLMKGGLVFADHISTVSDRYSKEILTKEYGSGLDGVLQRRAGRLHGILNGADYTTWNPEYDENLVQTYTPQTVTTGKAANKQKLIEEFELAPDSIDKPLVGVVSRLAYQKGIDLFIESVPDIVERDVRLAVLGMGEPNLEDALLQLSREFEGKLGVKNTFDDPLSHLTQAGADLFIVPSRYEPCGLTQLYSLKYGTIPIVRNTGGLADTVTDVDKDPEGNGFVFDDSSSEALVGAVERAQKVFRDKQRWNEIIQRAMSQDFSWNTSAKSYEDLYRLILQSD